jgi:hypothetical protein
MIPKSGAGLDVKRNISDPEENRMRVVLSSKN